MTQQKVPPGRKSASATSSGKERAVYVRSLSLENIRCFGPKQRLDLSGGDGGAAPWTIILGNNGTGKTTLLQLLVAFELVSVRDLRDRPKGLSVLPRGMLRRLQDSSHSNDFRGLQRIDSPEGECEMETVAGSRFGAGAEDVSKAQWSFDQGISWPAFSPRFFGYGAGRRLNPATLSQDEAADPVGTLFSDHASLHNAEEWLLRLDYAVSKPSKIQERQRKRLQKVKDLLITILPEVEQIRFSSPTKTSPNPRVEFQTPFGWVPLRQLGYGYQTLIAWVTDLAIRMVERYPDSSNPLSEPAIVVVDEIDLHLHPQWQRQLVDFLSQRFPKTQFIATAHSPLVVQAAAEANLAVLRRKGDHVEIDNDVDSIRGWRVDQILTSDLFDLPSARPPNIEKLFARRQELLDKTKRTQREDRELAEIEERLQSLPTGETAQAAKEMEAIRKSLDILRRSQGAR